MLEIFRNNIDSHLLNQVSTFIEVDSQIEIHLLILFPIVLLLTKQVYQISNHLKLSGLLRSRGTLPSKILFFFFPKGSYNQFEEAHQITVIVHAVWLHVSSTSFSHSLSLLLFCIRFQCEQEKFILNLNCHLKFQDLWPLKTL